MKKSAIFALFMLLFFITSACTNTPSPFNEDNTLIWAIPGIVSFGGGEGELGEQWQEAVDEALREKGADFTVRFLPIGGVFDGYYEPSEDGLWYHDKIFKMINEGDRIDIACISVGSNTEDAYMQAYTTGITTPLDEFLQSEAGRVIYDKYPRNVWNAMRINGEVNGVYAGTLRGAQYGYYFKKDWLTANPLFEPSMLSGKLSSLAETLQAENNALVLANLSQHSIAGMYELVSILPGIVLDNETACALYEHEAYTDYLRSLRAIPDPGKEKISQAGGEDIFWGNSEFPGVYPSWSDEYVTHPVSSPDLSSEQSALIINRHSEHKEQALQLLSWLYSDPAFADLLLYGVEGLHFIRENGVVYAAEGAPALDVDAIFFTGMFHTATPPAALDFPNPEYYAGVSERALTYMETLPDAPHTGFHFDSRGWEDTIALLDEIITKHTAQTEERDYDLPDFLRGLDENWEQAVVALNAELAEAGIHDLIAEVNKQYTEWSALYSPVK